MSDISKKNTKQDLLPLAKILKERLGHYDSGDLVANKERLVRMWRGAHPEAANETPSYSKPLMQELDFRRRNEEDPDEIWFNDIYNVSVRRYNKDVVFGTDSMIQLGISSHDGMARHDWRDMQAIKNQLAGEECEAFELFPAESRLLDPSNYYTLWCFPDVKRIKVGMEIRRVFDSDEALAPQRGFKQNG